MTEADPSSAIAAAIIAAAEIAKNGGGGIYAQNAEQTAEIPMVISEQSEKVPNGAVVMRMDSGRNSACSSQGTNDKEYGAHAVSVEHRGRENSEVSSHEGDETGENTFEEFIEDAEKRLARSRERNREHARRTRLRKKAQLEALQSKVKGLEAESKVLKQSIEECSIASILVGLSTPDEENRSEALSLLDSAVTGNDSGPKVALLTGGKRRRFVAESSEDKPVQTLKLNIDGQTTLIGGGKSHVNWKSGVYSDEHGVQHQLSSEQLESLRRERNRMHAKMTRDRKKNFIATIEKTIEDLENSNQRMRSVLVNLGHKQFIPAQVTPISSPQHESLEEPSLAPEPEVHNGLAALEPPAKRARRVSHGFVVNG